MTMDIAAYLSRYPREVAFGAEEADAVFDRYHTADFVLRNDGMELDRAKLIAHVRPARKRAKDVRVEVHESVTTGDRVAAHYTLTADMASGTTIATEIYMFGRLSADGRLERIDQITRDVSTRRAQANQASSASASPASDPPSEAA